MDGEDDFKRRQTTSEALNTNANSKTEWVFCNAPRLEILAAIALIYGAGVLEQIAFESTRSKRVREDAPLPMNRVYKSVRRNCNLL
jgi:hypothetical protein